MLPMVAALKERARRLQPWLTSEALLKQNFAPRYLQEDYRNPKNGKTPEDSQKRAKQPMSKFKIMDSTKHTARRKMVPTNMSMTSKMLLPARVVKTRPNKNMMPQSTSEVCQRGRRWPRCTRVSSTALTMVSVHAYDESRPKVKSMTKKRTDMTFWKSPKSVIA